MKELDTLDFQATKASFPDRYNRSDLAAIAIREVDPGEFTVQFPESDDAHRAVFATAAGKFYGSCSCKGYEHHELACSHLCAIHRARDAGLAVAGVLEISQASGDVRDPEQQRADQHDSTAQLPHTVTGP